MDGMSGLCVVRQMTPSDGRPNFFFLHLHKRILSWLCLILGVILGWRWRIYLQYEVDAYESSGLMSSKSACAGLMRTPVNS